MGSTVDSAREAKPPGAAAMPAARASTAAPPLGSGRDERGGYPKARGNRIGSNAAGRAKGRGGRELEEVSGKETRRQLEHRMRYRMGFRYCRGWLLV